LINDVDDTIREVVQRRVLNGSGVEVSFEAPTNDWAARQSGPALNFYLYDIREDLSRRHLGPIEGRDENGQVVVRRHPHRRYKLSYLSTAWTQRPEDEHRLLSAVLGAFIQDDVLPDEFLQGSLTHGRDPVLVTIALPPPQDRSLSDVWSALGGELKPSLDLVITAPFDPQRFFEVGPPVLEHLGLRVSSGDDLREEVSLAGRPNLRLAAAVSEDAGDTEGGTKAGTKGDTKGGGAESKPRPRNKRSPRK
jgi:Pvc16 N-terminal domain